MPLHLLLFQRKPRWGSLTRVVSSYFRGDLPHLSLHLLLCHLRTIVKKGKEVAFDATAEQPVRRGSPAYSSESASLAYKDMLEADRNDAERRELRDELMKARNKLTVGAWREKQMATEVRESQALRKALELEVKKSTAKINESDLEQDKGELDCS
ncbi:hypothetical protein ACOSQ4_024586 [Xanthoceras sorbifolium]